MAFRRDLCALCELNGIKIITRPFPGVHNVWEDRQSSIRDSSDWFLHLISLTYFQSISGPFSGHVLARRDTTVLTHSLLTIFFTGTALGVRESFVPSATPGWPRYPAHEIEPGALYSCRTRLASTAMERTSVRSCK